MLLQLSGIPGTGKSTLAKALGDQLGFVVLDSDVVKSALLRREVPLAAAGGATYAVILDVAAHLLAQGHDVLLDSPCRYRELLDSGQQIAAEVGVPYRFIELWAEDVSSVLPRLASTSAGPGSRRSRPPLDPSRAASGSSAHPSRPCRPGRTSCCARARTGCGWTPPGR